MLLHSTPCVNPQCNRPIGRECKSQRTNLCRPCRGNLMRRLVPTCGMIPSAALNAIARELLADTKPTRSERTDALRMMRGTRHREGPWEDRPAYSAAVVHAHTPRPKMARRLPEFLIGRRREPTPASILTAAVHYHLAVNVIGVGRVAALYLAGASYFRRRSLKRPDGSTREYRGKVVRNAYRLRFVEYVAIGRLALKAAKVMGVDDHSHAVWMTTRYLSGVEAGEFPRPIVVHPLSGITSGSGDHPLDHYLPRHDYAPNLPQFNSKIRRASGKIAGRDEYPAGLDVSLEDQRQATRRDAQTRFQQTQIRTAAAPSTDWLFS